MPSPPNKIPSSEVADRGDQIYAQKIAGHLDPALVGQVVAIDIHSEDFRVGPTATVACRQLRASHPDAQVWCVRIGSRSFHRIGRSPRASA